MQVRGGVCNSLIQGTLHRDRITTDFITPRDTRVPSFTLNGSTLNGVTLNDITLNGITLSQSR